MENATDALVMAGSVLLFLIALTIAISSFSSLRQGVDEIVGYAETVDMATTDEEYVNYLKANDQVTRTVGIETVMPAIYRSVSENYVVYLKLNNEKLNKDNLKKIVIIDNYSISDNTVQIKFTAGINQNIKEILESKLGETGSTFYDLIKDKTFDEKIGEYKVAGDNVSVENKETKRIITYTQIN